jgi:hypothetical protein
MSKGLSKHSVVTKDAAAIRFANYTATSIANYLHSSVLGKRPKLIHKGTKAAAAEAAAAAAEAIDAEDLGETKRLVAEFEALGGGALTMALTKAPPPETTCVSVDSRASGSACPRTARPAARKF